MDTKNAHYALVLSAILIGAVILTGCMQPGSGNGTGADDTGFRGRNFGNRTGGFGNRTDAQRQALVQERTQGAITACRGKAQNETCTLTGFTSRNGTDSNRTTPGTCQALNGTLMCRPEFQGRNGFGSRGPDGPGGQSGPTIRPSPTLDAYGQTPQ